MRESADAAQALLQHAYYGALSASKQHGPDEATLDLQKLKAFALIPENLPHVVERLQSKKAKRVMTYWAAASREAKTEQSLRTKLYPTLKKNPARLFPLGFREAPPQRISNMPPDRMRRTCADVARTSWSSGLESFDPQCASDAMGPGRKAKKPCMSSAVGGAEGSRDKRRENQSARQKVNELLALYQRKELPIFAGKLTSELL